MRTRPPAISAATLAIGGVVLVAIAGVAIAAFAGGDAPAAPTTVGYSVLPGCTGILVTDRSKALAEAARVGAAVSVASGTGGDWHAETERILGLGPARTCGSYPPQARAFAFELVRASAEGATRANRITSAQASGVLSDLRTSLRRQGVDPRVLE